MPKKNSDLSVRDMCNSERTLVILEGSNKKSKFIKGSIEILVRGVMMLIRDNNKGELEHGLMIVVNARRLLTFCRSTRKEE